MSVMNQQKMATKYLSNGTNVSSADNSYQIKDEIGSMWQEWCYCLKVLLIKCFDRVSLEIISKAKHDLVWVF